MEELRELTSAAIDPSLDGWSSALEITEMDHGSSLMWGYRDR